MLTRNENGKLSFNTLDFECLIDDLFDLCKTEHEVNWVVESLSGIIENESDRYIEELGEDDD